MFRARVRSARIVPVFLAAFTVLLIGCARDRADTSAKVETEAASRAMSPPAMDMAAGMEAAAPDAMVASLPPASLPAIGRTLIRNASLTLVVTAVDSAAIRIERLVAREGGYLEHASASARGEFPSRDYRVRVPAAKLDAVLAELRTLAVRVDLENQDIQDVTDQVVDVEARMRTLRATEIELLALLRESRSRGQKVQDIMAVYHELTQIRTQIEQLDGQLQSLEESERDVDGADLARARRRRGSTPGPDVAAGRDGARQPACAGRDAARGRRFPHRLRDRRPADPGTAGWSRVDDRARCGRGASRSRGTLGSGGPANP